MSKRWTMQDIERVQNKGQVEVPVNNTLTVPPLQARTVANHLVGIDPGVRTGFALWMRKEKSFVFIRTVGIITVQNWFIRHPHPEQLFVRLEDARQRVWFGDAGKEKLQGAGSIKRDCQIWEEFFDFMNIRYELVPPKNNKTKLDAKLFSKYTGWKESTNEHGRDAAMLVYGL